MKDTTTTITNRARAKRKANKIASIVCLAFVGVLILTTILLAVIPVNTGAYRHKDYIDHYPERTMHPYYLQGHHACRTESIKAYKRLFLIK